eukprot:1935535-Heterocapsa_arctica.AAC.1
MARATLCVAMQSLPATLWTNAVRTSPWTQISWSRVRVRATCHVARAGHQVPCKAGAAVDARGLAVEEHRCR